MVVKKKKHEKGRAGESKREKETKKNKKHYHQTFPSLWAQIHLNPNYQHKNLFQPYGK